MKKITISHTLETIQEFMAGPGLALWVLSLLFSFSAMALLVLCIPPSAEPLAVFAKDFKVWCFGYDPQTGSLPWASLISFFLGPLLLGSITFILWREPLREIRQRPLVLFGHLGAALLVGLGSVAGLYFLYAPTAPAREAFPGQSLRTQLTPPAFTLIDQEGRSISLAACANRVVVITGVYSTCGYTCPMIMAQAKRLVAALTPEEKAQLTVLAITLDPERDNPQALKAMAEFHHLEDSHFLTGNPSEVHRTLDALGFSRQKDPATGVIAHANLFLLIDRQGRLAYRFSLGELQEKWLIEATRLLIGEKIAKESTNPA